MARAGLAFEVLFPDFGLPFELYAPLLEVIHDYHRSWEQRNVANQAYTRTGEVRLAAIRVDDVEAAIEEIHWAKKNGLRGVLLPMFDDDYPIFHERYDRWSTLEELGIPVNSHIAISGATRRLPHIPAVPHPTVAEPNLWRRAVLLLPRPPEPAYLGGCA
jgi:hypothetical protein